MMGEGGSCARGTVDIEQLVHHFSEELFADLAPDDYAGRMVRRRQAIDHMELGFAGDAAAFAADEQFVNDDSTSPIEWMRHDCKMSFGTAVDRLTVGEQLLRLPKSATALASGAIGFATMFVCVWTVSIQSRLATDQ